MACLSDEDIEQFKNEFLGNSSDFSDAERIGFFRQLRVVLGRTLVLNYQMTTFFHCTYFANSTSSNLLQEFLETVVLYPIIFSTNSKKMFKSYKMNMSMSFLKHFVVHFLRNIQKPNHGFVGIFSQTGHGSCFPPVKILQMSMSSST